MFNSGHMSEHLVWAPDPRDDVAFNLYAMEEEEIREAKSQIITGLVAGEYAAGNSFDFFKRDMLEIFPISNQFNDQDWLDIYAFW